MKKQMPGTTGGRLILVRHAETAANLRRVFADSDDIPLTDAGRAQAEQLAHRLAREFRPNVLVSSHFRRARQTSEIIGRILGLTPETIVGIHERDFGELRGHPYERFVESPHLAEPLDSVRRRAMAALDSLRVKYPAHQVVVVSHGAVIRSVCAYITGSWSEDSVPPNCGVVTIEYDARAWGILVKTGDWDPITTL